MTQNTLQHRQGQIFHDIETMTPSIARSYLEDAAVNRSISEPAVKRYAAAMKKGQWTLSQPICFDAFGKLVDGQHRLMAVIKADMPVKFNVLRGIANIRHLDAGRARKASDVLQMLGFKNANTLAAIARMVMVSEGDNEGFPLPSGTRGADITLDDIIKRCEEDSAISYIAAQVNGTEKVFSRMLKSSAIAGWFIYMVSNSDIDGMILDDFLDQASGRQPGMDTNPAVVLYRTLNNSRTDQRRMGKKERLALLIKAWNAYVSNREIKKLFYRGFGTRAENFPTLNLTNGDSQ